MENQTVKQLKTLARERSIKGYYKMRKAELIEALEEESEIFYSANDKTVPEVNIPIPAPSRVTQMRNLASNVAAPVKSVINRFTGWLLNYIPEPIKSAVNERVENLKDRVNSIFRRREEVGQPIEDVNSPEEDNLTPREYKTAIKGYFKTFRVNGIDGMDEKTFMNNVKPRVINLIKSKGSIKVKLILTVRFTKENPATGNIDINVYSFASKMEIVTESTDIPVIYDQMTSLIFELIQNFQNRGSGWQFDRVEHLDININPFNPLSASSYIELPSSLADKKAIINAKNENDNECFKWAVTSAVFPAEKNAERLSKQMRKDSEKFDWTGIEFPVSLKQIDKFENQNNYAINVFGYERVVYPLRISKKKEQVINLLLIANEETNHFCWIKNMSRLLSSGINNHQHKRYFCYRCLNSFHSEKSLNKHTEYCQNNEAVKIEMPMIKDDEEKFLGPEYIYFKNHYKKQRVPFVVYAVYKKYKRARSALLNLSTGSGTLSVALCGGGLGTGLTGVGLVGGVCALTSVATASFAKAVSGKVSKHEKTVSVCQAKINTIKDVVSKSLTDNKISHEEFVLIKSEYEKYYEMKRSIREKNTTPTLPQVDVKKMEEDIRAEILKKTRPARVSCNCLIVLSRDESFRDPPYNPYFI